MNLDLIPCEICNQSFPPEQYNIHITICTPNHLHNQFNQTFNTNHNHNNQNNGNSNNISSSSFDTIPCDKCSQQIPIKEYESHLLMHSLSSPINTTNNHNSSSSSSNIPPSILPLTVNTIPCDKCHQQIPADQYETHQFLHLDDTQTINNHNNNNLMMVECKYSDCSTKWIPKHEYQDHLTLHQLQSQQNIPNTANDELIAFNHQTQLIQQQTAIMNPTTNTPDPRRICLSPSFSHLHDTQRPVIPLHDALTPFITNNLFSSTSHSDDIPLRDHHCVNGIIEAIDYVLSSRHHIEYYLCDPLQFYYRDREDYSWGCGFRNCQTLSSCLILKKNPLDTDGRECGVYSHCLFNGIGYVPQIEQIQRYLDYAHAQGFDPEGLKELGQTEGRRVWIGAVDVAAILRSFYIPAAIFDFQLNRSHQSEEIYHDDLYQWVWQYFQQRYDYHGIGGHNHGNNGNQRNNGGQTLISSYFQTQNDDEDMKNNKKGKEEEYGALSDEDLMLQKALEMSKKQMVEENKKEDIKRKKKGKKNGKMEMDEDSDSGSSFSDDENVFDAQIMDKNKNKMEQEEEEEEKKSDENEEDLFYWDQDNENVMKSDWKQTKVDHEWKQRKQKMMNQDNKNKKDQRKKGGQNNGGYNQRFIPPLYFQHQGHSRTIIGIMRNRRSGITHLLVLDPSIKKGAVNLLNNIKNGNINSLLRSKKQTKAAKYQIVAIPAYGIMTNNDRNRCKTIQSMDVTLMNKIKNNNNNNNNHNH